MKRRLGAVAGILLLLVSGCETKSVDIDAPLAWSTSVDYVRDRNRDKATLRLPDSPDVNCSVTRIAPGWYKVAAWSEVGNGYGGTIHQKWFTEVQKGDDSAWKVTKYDYTLASDAEILPPVVTIKPADDARMGSPESLRAPAFAAEEDYLNYESLRRDPHNAPPNGEVYDENMMIANGKMIYLTPGDQVKPIHGGGDGEWEVELLSGPNKGKSYYIGDWFISVPPKGQR